MPRMTASLGQEFDHGLRRALRSVLEDLGVNGPDDWWLIGGSNSQTLAEIVVRGEFILVEADTYTGLTISGERSLVEEISSKVSTRRITAGV